MSIDITRLSDSAREQIAREIERRRSEQTARSTNALGPEKKVAGKKNRMNQWETDYAGRLEMQRIAGEIDWWSFEPMRLRLAKATGYTPDFIVVSQGRISAHEVKGFWRDDARVKLKVAAEMYRWIRFVIVTRCRGEFMFEELNIHG